jgi:hypothetical protein
LLGTTEGDARVLPGASGALGLAHDVVLVKWPECAYVNSGANLLRRVSPARRLVQEAPSGTRGRLILLPGVACRAVAAPLSPLDTREEAGVAWCEHPQSFDLNEQRADVRITGRDRVLGIGVPG